MTEINVSKELDDLLSKIQEIPSNKEYWLIRTQSGSLYDTFIEKEIAGLDHTEVSHYELNSLRDRSDLDDNQKYVEVRHLVRSYYEQNPDQEKTPRAIGLIASQIHKMYFKAKVGDIVIIPSENSSKVSFGIIKQFHTTEVTSENIKGFLYKKVKWLETIHKSELDPYIYRILTAHQAIVSVKNYAEVIERSLNQFFILQNEAHFVINVQKRDKIKAHELFGLGYSLTELVKEYIAEYNVSGASIDDLDATINLNSPGKINLKSATKRVTVIALIIVSVIGGGLTINEEGLTLQTDGLPGLIKSVSDFLDKKKDRELKEAMFQQYKDSLEVEGTEDLIKMLKQVDGNKDLPKSN